LGEMSPCDMASNIHQALRDDFPVRDFAQLPGVCAVDHVPAHAPVPRGVHGPPPHTPAALRVSQGRDQ
jgi:hypothetical protein